MADTTRQHRGEQLAFPPPTPPKRWGLIVDEVRLNATASPAGTWWCEQAARFEARGTARILNICIAGAIVEYGPWDRDDADFIHGHMVERGINPKFLTLREWMPDLPECTRAGRCRRCARSHAARRQETAA